MNRLEHYLKWNVIIKNPPILLFMATWMRPKVIMLNAINQEQKVNCHLIGIEKGCLCNHKKRVTEAE